MIKFSILSLHYAFLDCPMESVEHSCCYWLMKVGLSDQVIITAKTRQGLLNRNKASWEVLTWLVPRETRELFVREHWAMTAPQAGAKGDSKVRRGVVLAEEGHTPEHKAEQAQWLQSGRPVWQCWICIKSVQISKIAQAWLRVRASA